MSFSIFIKVYFSWVVKVLFLHSVSWMSDYFFWSTCVKGFQVTFNIYRSSHGTKTTVHSSFFVRAIVWPETLLGCASFIHTLPGGLPVPGWTMWINNREHSPGEYKSRSLPGQVAMLAFALRKTSECSIQRFPGSQGLPRFSPCLL